MILWLEHEVSETYRLARIHYQHGDIMSWLVLSAAAAELWKQLQIDKDEWDFELEQAERFSQGPYIDPDEPIYDPAHEAIDHGLELTWECPVCHAPRACGYDDEGRLWIHVLNVEDDL